MASHSVFLAQVVPIIGGVVAACLFTSPLAAVLSARRSGTIGDLNVVPYVFICANCMAWTCYAFVTDDPYVFVPNAFGLLIGMYLFLVSYGLIRDQTQRDRLVSLTMPLSALLLLVAALERLFLKEAESNYDARKQLWGYTANAVLLCFYSSPLSTVANVIRTRDSSSLTLPLCVMNIVNGSLWLIYGLAVGDYFIWVPNGVGALLGAFQTSLCLVFSKKAPLPRAGSDLPLTAVNSATNAVVTTSQTTVSLPCPRNSGSRPGSGDQAGRTDTFAARA